MVKTRAPVVKRASRPWLVRAWRVNPRFLYVPVGSGPCLPACGGCPTRCLIPQPGGHRQDSSTQPWGSPEGACPLWRGSGGVPQIPQNTSRAGGWEGQRPCCGDNADAAHAHRASNLHPTTAGLEGQAVGRALRQHAADMPARRFVAHKQQKAGTSNVPASLFVISGDPEGIRTPDLHRDRVAC